MSEVVSDVLFFTYADSKYDFFAVPYAYFALRNNATAKVEICFEDFEVFASRQKAAIETLCKLYPGRVLFRQADIVLKQKNIIPNTVRFVEKPITKCAYIYIGDIDLLVFDDVLKVHLTLIESHALPFSNILRQEHALSETPRLSGLHFCKYDLYYPLPDIDDLDLAKANDEYVLYEIMKRHGFMVSGDFQMRPECGIHMSLNRDPLGRSTGSTARNFSVQGGHGWGGDRYHSCFLVQIAEVDFCLLLPQLDFDFRVLLLAAEALATKQGRKLHRAACAYFVDKRMLVGDKEVSLKSVMESRTRAIEAKDYSTAVQAGNVSLLLWPRNIEIWFKQAWLWFALGEIDNAVEALLHICELPNGINFLRETDMVLNKMQAIRKARAGGSLLEKLGN